MQEADAAVETEVMRETTFSSPLRLNQLFFWGHSCRKTRNPEDVS